MSKIKKIAEANFKLYPKRDKQFIFPDGVCFFREAQAKDYAKPSKQKYETVTRELKKGDTLEMTKEQAEETLMGLELDKSADYELLGDLVEALELKPEGKSKDDRIKVLLPVRNDLLGIDNQ
ncbi:MAG: hypothetical protein JEZ14_15090 [Marinilabiliaceae bacterium]|nr:hypothetical protein [Marinilabiliaceae bacterium]